jgi:hypothetical protein
MDTPQEVKLFMRQQLADAGLERVLPTHHE